MSRAVLILASIFTLLVVLASETHAREITVRGYLARTVEAGGWVIVAEREKYLILNTRRFEGESWFSESKDVEATGDTKPGVVTIYQEGIPFEVRSMRPVSAGRGSDSSSDRPTRVVVTGDSIVRAEPDTAMLSIAVVTQNKTALEAQRENANRTDAVVRAVKAATGAGAEVKTGGYQIQPQRVYKENQPPTITGYEVRNSVTVTMEDLTRVGQVIDAATQAGANNIDNVSFTLRKDQEARERALQEATREAVSKARSVAQSLGGSFLRVVQVRENGPRPRPIYNAEYGALRSAGAEARPTPIEVGTLEITSHVQLIAEIRTM